MRTRDENEVVQNWAGKTDPVLSICCITYNHERFISEAIESFLMQETDFPFEIVIGEDCSTDKTLQIIHRYQQRFPLILKVITSDSNVGGNLNLLRTIRSCKGNYIAFCEGDDFWVTRDKLQKQYSTMKMNPECYFSFHKSKTLNSVGDLFDSELNYKSKVYKKEEILLEDFHFIQSNTIMFKRHPNDNKLYDFLSNSSICDFFIRTFYSSFAGAICIPEYMGCYRVLSTGSWSSSTIKDGTKFAHFICRFIKEIRNFAKNFNTNSIRTFNKYITKLVSILILHKGTPIKKRFQCVVQYTALLSLIEKIAFLSALIMSILSGLVLKGLRMLGRVSSNIRKNFVMSFKN